MVCRMWKIQQCERKKYIVSKEMQNVDVCHAIDTQVLGSKRSRYVVDYAQGENNGVR